MSSSYEELPKKSPVLHWVAIIALAVVAAIGIWSCSSWKSEAEINQSNFKVSQNNLKAANAEISRANGIILEQRTEVTRLDNEIEKSNAEIRRLEREITEAIQVINNQNTYINCKLESNETSGILGVLGNLIAPGVGGAVGSALGQKEC